MTHLMSGRDLRWAASAASKARADLRFACLQAVGEGSPKSWVAGEAGVSRSTLDRWIAESVAES